MALRNLVRSHGWIWKKGEKPSPPAWLLNDIPSSFNSENRFISVSFAWARSRDSLSELQGLEVGGTLAGRAAAPAMWALHKKHLPGPWPPQDTAAFYSFGCGANIFCYSCWSFFWLNIRILFSSLICGLCKLWVGKILWKNQKWMWREPGQRQIVCRWTKGARLSILKPLYRHCDWPFTWFWILLKSLTLTFEFLWRLPYIGMTD